MNIPYQLLQVIVIPIFAAIICAVSGKRLGKNLAWIALIALAYTTLLLANVGYNLWISGGQISESYPWSTSVLNLNFGFLADGLSLPVAIIINIICAASAIYSFRYMEHRIEALYGKEDKTKYSIYYSFLLLLPVSFVGISLSTNLIEMFLFTELALVPTYVIIDYFGYLDKHRIAIMSFMWGQAGAAVFLIGVVLASAGDGSFEISALSTLNGTSLGFLVCLFIIIGWLVKMATFGFHVWVPYVDAEPPTSMAAILAIIVGLGSYVIARLLFVQLYTSFQVFSVPLMILAIITLIYGAFLTLAQDDVKRLYACSTISQTAYSLLGIASLTTLGAEGGVFYFISHILGKFILFSVAGIIVTQTGVRNIKEMGGLAHKMPLTATLCIVGSMILSAMPPTSGFQAEWILFSGVFQQGINGATINIVIAVIGIFATFLTAVYTFWPVIRIFFGELPSSLEKAKEAPLSMTIPLFILVILALIIGIYPALITHFLSAFFI